MRAPKVNWSIVMLASSLVTLSAVAFQAHRASEKHRDTVLGLLADYADGALFNYKAQLNAQLGDFVSALHASDAVHPTHDGVIHSPLGNRRIPAPETCPCGGAFVHAQNQFRYSAADRSLRFLHPAAPEVEALIASEVESHLDAARTEPWVLRILPDGDHLIAFHRDRRGTGGLDVIGAIAPLSELTSLLERRVDRKALLPASITKGVPVDSLVYVAVYLPGSSEALFTNSPQPRWFQAAEETLPPTQGELLVRAAIREEHAPLLVVGGLPRSRLPLLLLLLAISGGLALLAVAQMRRERALVRTRENFVTSVSHELRTPLAQMRLYIDTLRMGRASTRDDREWALSHIERETTRLTHLVENVLHLSRPRQSSAKAAPVIDASAEIAEVVETFRPLARSRRARLVTRSTPDAMVAMRREHLRQVVLNLLDNAVKYGAVGQQVTVETRTDGDVVQILVRDEGPGVLPHERERIWAPYFRGSTPEALASGGTGVGLSIVRELVGQYDGSAALAPGEGGATFVITLRRLRIAPHADENLTAQIN